MLQRRIISYVSKYLGKRFDLFPHALEVVDKLKDKVEWAKELDELMCIRLNKFINEKGHIWFAKKNKEVVQVQIFFDSFKKEFDEIKKLGEDVVKKQQEILKFNWPDDSLFNKWMEDLAQSNQLIDKETDESGVDPHELQIIDAPDERKEDQLVAETAAVSQTGDVAAEKPIITVGLSVHNDLEGDQ